MYRKPETKAQARILQSVFEAHGVNIAHREALDVLARMNGHANWHVMREYEKAIRPAAKAAQASLPATPAAIERDHVYTFEAVGFVENREVLDSLVGSYYAELPPALHARMEALGFYSFCRVDLSEDDNQGTTDIKVFVTLRMVGPGAAASVRYFAIHGHDSAELQSFFNDVALLISQDATGNDVVNSSNWEFIEATGF